VRAGIRPKVSMEVVLIAKSSAGLKPGKNFSNPNQKKITPTLKRNSVMP